MLVLAAAALLTAAGPSQALSLGMDARGARGPEPARLNAFVYPCVGYTLDLERFHLDVESPLPVLFPDGIAAAISFLSGGPDHIPLWYALNGGAEPGAVNIWDATAALVVPFESGVAFEVGARTSFRFVSVLLPDDERISIQPVNAASSIGLRAGSLGGHVLRGRVFAGNGFTRFARWNPTAGVDARANLALGGPFELEIGGGYAWQRFDLSEYREPVSGERLFGAGWFGFWTAEVRLGYRWDAR